MLLFSSLSFFYRSYIHYYYCVQHLFIGQKKNKIIIPFVHVNEQWNTMFECRLETFSSLNVLCAFKSQVKRPRGRRKTQNTKTSDFIPLFWVNYHYKNDNRFRWNNYYSWMWNKFHANWNKFISLSAQRWKIEIECYLRMTLALGYLIRS